MPFIGRVRFANVDGQKIGVIFIVVIDLNNVANLATEGRSSEAAKDKNERLARGTFTNPEMIGAVKSNEPGIGSGVTDF